MLSDARLLKGMSSSSLTLLITAYKICNFVFLNMFQYTSGKENIALALEGATCHCSGVPVVSLAGDLIYAGCFYSQCSIFIVLLVDVSTRELRHGEEISSQAVKDNCKSQGRP